MHHFYYVYVIILYRANSATLYRDLRLWLLLSVKDLRGARRVFSTVRRGCGVGLSGVEVYWVSGGRCSVLGVLTQSAKDRHGQEQRRCAGSTVTIDSRVALRCERRGTSGTKTRDRRLTLCTPTMPPGHWRCLGATTSSMPSKHTEIHTDAAYWHTSARNNVSPKYVQWNRLRNDPAIVLSRSAYRHATSDTHLEQDESKSELLVDCAHRKVEVQRGERPTGVIHLGNETGYWSRADPRPPAADLARRRAARTSKNSATSTSSLELVYLPTTFI